MSEKAGVSLMYGISSSNPNCNGVFTAEPVKWYHKVLAYAYMYLYPVAIIAIWFAAIATLISIQNRL